MVGHQPLELIILGSSPSSPASKKKEAAKSFRNSDEAAVLTVRFEMGEKQLL